MLAGIPEGMPVIMCEIADGNGGEWRFFCPYCRRYHRHSSGAGHRAAHCDTGPWAMGGYWLVI
jgi:hypothetical protein